MSDQFFDKEKTRNYSLIAGAVVALLFLIFKKWTWSTGIVLGTGAGLCNFYLLYKDFANLFPSGAEPAPRQPRGAAGLSAERAPGLAAPCQPHGAADPSGERPLEQAARKPSPFSMAGKFFLRYLLLAVLFFLAFKIPGVHFAGFVLGFFLVHVNLGVVSFMRLMRPGSKQS